MAANGEHNRQEDVGGLVPRPDPTLLTSAALAREIANLREIIEARLDAMDHATDLRINQINHTPGEIKEQIEHLEQLQNQKFDGIALQFLERDVRTEQASKAAKEALDAALLSAKELVTAQNESNTAAAIKTETSFTKQIDQTATLISTLEKAIDSRINELKERLDRGEGTASGMQSGHDESRANWGLVIAAAVGAASLAATVAHFLH